MHFHATCRLYCIVSSLGTVQWFQNYGIRSVNSAKLNSEKCSWKVFLNFLSHSLPSKFRKMCYEPKNFLPQIRMGCKKCRTLCLVQIHQIVAKMFVQKMLSTKTGWKMTFLTFHGMQKFYGLFNFLCVNFLQLFSTDSRPASNSVCLIPFKLFSWQALFAKLWHLARRERLKKI